jgi:hypothetical protein
MEIGMAAHALMDAPVESGRRRVTLEQFHVAAVRRAAVEPVAHTPNEKKGTDHDSLSLRIHW